MANERNVAGWLPNVGPFTVQNNGVDLPRRGTVNYVDSTDSGGPEDDPDNDRTNIPKGSSGGGTVSNDGAKLEVGKTGTSHLRTIDAAGDTGGKSGTQATDIVNLRPLPPGQINVKDHGALGDTTTDDRADIAFAAALAGNAKLHFPAGTYRVASDLTIGSTVHVHFEEGAILAPDSGKTVTIQGRVSCHPNQQVFGGAGAIALTHRAFDRATVKNFGAQGDDSTDDAGALQRTFDTCIANLTPPMPVHFPGGIYRTSAALTIPATAAVQLTGAVAHQGVGPTIKATADIDAILDIGDQFVIKGINFDGNANAKRGVVCRNATFSRFQNCTFRNATRDGLQIVYGDATLLLNCGASGNGVIFCANAGVAGQYDGYISANSGHDQTTVLQSSTNDDIALVVEADRHTITATTPTGTIDFLALGLRYGDIIRFGGGSTGFPDSSAQFAQITQVLNANTIMVAGYLRRPVAGGYADWAISRGDGVRCSGPGANNSQLGVLFGVYQYNAGSGIALPGAGVDEVGGSANFIFGTSINGAEPQYNGAAGILIGQHTCENGAAPSVLAGITYDVTNGSATVTASASVDGLIAPGAFFTFASDIGGAICHVASVSGATITLAAPYTGASNAATTIASFDPHGSENTNIKIENCYGENNAAGALKISRCYSGTVDFVHGLTFNSANPDILDDEASIKVLHGEFPAPGVTGVGGYSNRGSVEEIGLGGLFSSVRNASLANLRDGYENQSSTDPAAGSTIDTTRSYQRIALSADLVMTATPTFAAPNISANTINYSMILYVQCAPGSAGSLTLQDESVLAGSKLALATPTLTLHPGGGVFLMWDLYANQWEEFYRGGAEEHVPAVAMSTLDIDWSKSNVFTKTLAAGANAITFSNATSGHRIKVRLTSDGGGSTVSWPAGTKFIGGVSPTQSTPGKTDTYELFHDGTNVYLVREGADFS